jgi:hypothetical protein
MVVEQIGLEGGRTVLGLQHQLEPNVAVRQQAAAVRPALERTAMFVDVPGVLIAIVRFTGFAGAPRCAHRAPASGRGLDDRARPLVHSQPRSPPA